jgi:hypothetical protein
MASERGVDNDALERQQTSLTIQERHGNSLASISSSSSRLTSFTPLYQQRTANSCQADIAEGIRHSQQQEELAKDKPKCCLQ